MSGTPIITTLDIETAPLLLQGWGLRDQNFGLSQMMDPGRVLGFGAKVLGKPVEWRSEYHDGADEMIDRAWQILDESDVIVHFNGTRFDLPWLRREFAVREMGLPSPIQEIDLMRVARKQFYLPSYKLQFISTYLGLEGKMGHEGHGLWVKCLEGDEKAWATMRRYCKQDVALTEKLYLKLRPYVPTHPHLGLYAGDGESVCARCGSSKLERRGYAYTALSVFQQYRCNDCGSWSRGGKSLDRAGIRGVS